MKLMPLLVETYANYLLYKQKTPFEKLKFQKIIYTCNLYILFEYKFLCSEGIFLIIPKSSVCRLSAGVQTGVTWGIAVLPLAKNKIK